MLLFFAYDNSIYCVYIELKLFDYSIRKKIARVLKACKLIGSLVEKKIHSSRGGELGGVYVFAAAAVAYNKKI